MAAIAKEEEKTPSEPLNCPICLEPYTVPRSLSCLHSFCEGCIQSHIIQTAGNGTSADKIQCPLCRAETAAPTPDRPRAEWARELPPNCAFGPLVSSEKSVLQPSCDNCKGFDKISAAKSFCEDCKQYQCEECVTIHNKAVVMKGHVINEIEQHERSIGVKLHLGNLEYCPNHLERLVEFYCEDDEVVCCGMCAFKHHKACGNVAEVQELGQRWKDGGKPLELDTQMEELMARLLDVNGKLDQNVSDLEDQAEGIPKRMVEVRDKVVLIMDELVGKVTRECAQMKKQHALELDDKKTSTRSMEAAITTARSMLQSLLDHGTVTQIVIVINKLEKQVALYESQVQDLLRNTSTVRLHLQPNELLQKVLQSCGALDAEVTAELVNLTQVPIVDCIAECLPVVDIKKQPGLEQPWYVGAEYLQNGRIVAVDRKNRMLCLMGEDFILIASVLLPSCPRDVTVIGKSEIVVSFPETKELRRVAMNGDTLSLQGAIPCSRKPLSLSKLNDTELVVGFESGFGIVSLDGNEKMFIDKDTHGREIKFSEYDNILVDSKEKQRVYRSRWDDNAVYCLDFAGKVIFEYCGSMKRPCGLGLDRDRNLYVCCRYTHKIHQLTPDGELVSVIDPRMVRPCIICFSPTGDTMTVIKCYENMSDQGTRIQFHS